MSHKRRLLDIDLASYPPFKKSRHVDTPTPDRVHNPRRKYANHADSRVGSEFHALPYPLTLLPYDSWSLLHNGPTGASKSSFRCINCTALSAQPTPHQRKLFLVAERLSWDCEVTSREQRERNESLNWEVNFELGITEPAVEDGTEEPGGKHSRGNQWYPFCTKQEMEAAMTLLTRATKLNGESWKVWMEMTEAELPVPPKEDGATGPASTLPFEPLRVVEDATSTRQPLKEIVNIQRPPSSQTCMSKAFGKTAPQLLTPPSSSPMDMNAKLGLSGGSPSQTPGGPSIEVDWQAYQSFLKDDNCQRMLSRFVPMMKFVQHCNSTRCLAGKRFALVGDWSSNQWDVIKHHITLHGGTVRNVLVQNVSLVVLGHDVKWKVFEHHWRAGDKMITKLGLFQLITCATRIYPLFKSSPTKPMWNESHGPRNCLGHIPLPVLKELFNRAKSDDSLQGLLYGIEFHIPFEFELLNFEKIWKPIAAEMGLDPGAARPADHVPAPPPNQTERAFDYSSIGNANAQPAAVDAKQRSVVTTDCLAGLSFVFTGELPTLTREAGHSLVKQYGGKVYSAPSRNTSYIVFGSNVSVKKLQTIRSENLRTLDEDGLYELIQRRRPSFELSPGGFAEASNSEITVSSGFNAPIPQQALPNTGLQPPPSPFRAMVDLACAAIRDRSKHDDWLRRLPEKICNGAASKHETIIYEEVLSHFAGYLQRQACDLDSKLEFERHLETLRKRSDDYNRYYRRLSVDEISARSPHAFLSQLLYGQDPVPSGGSQAHTLNGSMFRLLKPRADAHAPQPAALKTYVSPYADPWLQGSYQVPPSHSQIPGLPSGYHTNTRNGCTFGVLNPQAAPQISVPSRYVSHRTIPSPYPHPATSVASNTSTVPSYGQLPLASVPVTYPRSNSAPGYTLYTTARPAATAEPSTAVAKAEEVAFTQSKLSFRTLPEFYSLLDKIERTSYVGARYLEAYAEYLQNADECSECWFRSRMMDEGELEKLEEDIMREMDGEI